MDFWQAIVSGFKNYVGFRGRACRSEYWYWVLALFTDPHPKPGLIGPVVEYGPVNSIFSVATFLPTLAIGIRRLHDIDRTGWWTLIWLTAIGAFLLIYWACVRGTPGPNRFGPDPLAGQT